MRDVLGRAAVALNRFSERFLPSAFGLAVALTAITFALACAFGFSDANVLARPAMSIKAWGNGLSGLLSFAMQMCLVMMTGTIVAESPAFKRALTALSSIPRSPKQAVAWMGFLSMAMGLVHWGVSIVGSAVLARAIARKHANVDYRLLVAAAYLGLGCTWHAGLSASAPMSVAAAKNDFVAGGYLAAPVPASDTLGSAFNLGLAALVVLVMVLVVAWLHPDAEHTVTAPPNLLTEDNASQLEDAPGWLDRSRLAPYLLACLVGCYLCLVVREKGARGVDINTVNWAFLVIGLLLHGSLGSFSAAAVQGARSLHGIVIQFPLYAGMGALIKESGIATRLADLIVAHASAHRFPLLVYWYSGLVNYFVPSGGSKFAIEAPYLFPAAQTLGVAPSSVVLSYAWGDMMTDIIQPFWAIPLLAVARLDFRAISGYCMILFVVYAALVSAAFTWFL